MSKMRNEFLDHGDSDESDLDAGYDSEAAEVSKGAKSTVTLERATKKRKLSHSDYDNDDEGAGIIAKQKVSAPNVDNENYEPEEDADEASGSGEDVTSKQPQKRTQTLNTTSGEAISTNEPSRDLESKSRSKSKKKDKELTPGVIYLSSLPPYLKPSALRNLLVQRGFEPITRLFLTPASKAKTTSKKNSRQLYTEGWVEFASKKTARRCAETLNAQIIGGKKSGFYYDDLWNMKYLRGMSWGELMAGIREEKREEEGRRDEERRTIARETKRFVEGVEEGKRIEGIKRKRSGKGKNAGVDGDEDVKRTWRQFEVKGKEKGGSRPQKHDGISDDVKEVLGKIF